MDYAQKVMMMKDFLVGWVTQKNNDYIYDRPLHQSTDECDSRDVAHVAIASEQL